jgi:hypothetical protein
VTGLVATAAIRSASADGLKPAKKIKLTAAPGRVSLVGNAIQIQMSGATTAPSPDR